MRYKYRMYGQSPILWVPLDRDTSFLSVWTSVGTANEYWIDTSIASPLRRPLRVNGNHLRLISQCFRFHINEMDGSASLSRSAVGSGQLFFGIFQMTRDIATGLDRPFSFVPIMGFGCSTTLKTMSSTLAFFHTSQGESPYGPVYSGNDYDIIDNTYFTAAADGLMTSIQFGWWRVYSSSVNVMSGMIEFKGVSLLVDVLQY